MCFRGATPIEQPCEEHVRLGFGWQQVDAKRAAAGDGPILRIDRDHSYLRFPRLPAVGSCHMGRHVISTWIGMSFLMGNVNSDGGSILKSDMVAGIVPLILTALP